MAALKTRNIFKSQFVKPKVTKASIAVKVSGADSATNTLDRIPNLPGQGSKLVCTCVFWSSASFVNPYLGSHRDKI